ncbi:MAG: type II toxin-antitoxin system HicA family toxin [archaeon]|nr:type II toxin-antitoxin system HicA family toxin [archaeon]
MSRLVALNYDRVVRVLSKIGYESRHQKGSHIVMRLADKHKYSAIFGKRKADYMITVPAHKPIGKGMVRTIMKEAGLSVDEFNGLL